MVLKPICEVEELETGEPVDTETVISRKLLQGEVFGWQKGSSHNKTIQMVHHSHCIITGDPTVLQNSPSSKLPPPAAQREAVGARCKPYTKTHCYSP
ncbi:hypothetical protein FKM82_003724 [Ascaphus truei]